jgi:YidC/Oxa1 family membrane protein insertase
MIAGLFEPPAWLLAKFYEMTNNYIVAISLIALVVMVLTAPLQLKATKGMLEMQRLQPQLKKLQQEHRGDRQKLNEEMMKLYQQHKVNPLASCFPLLLQFPVFIVMFRVLHGLTRDVTCGAANVADLVCKGVPAGKVVFAPQYVSPTSKLAMSLFGKSEMLSWGLDLAKRPFQVIGQSFSEGIVYALLVIVLGFLYFVQQKMVAARATMSPTMSPMQQKLMQYLPVVFAVFLVFYLTGLVIYYMAQAIFRIGLQYYITHRFYKGEHSLGQQALKAGNEARDLAKNDKAAGGGGLFAQAKRDTAASKDGAGRAGGKSGGRPAPSSTSAAVSKRVTAPKSRPTSSGRSGRPAPSGKAIRPAAPAPRTPKKK